MLDQRWTPPSLDLKELPPDEKAAPDDQAIVIAVSFAFLLHLLLLSYWSLDTARVPRSSSLKVSLVTPPARNKTVEKKRPEKKRPENKKAETLTLLPEVPQQVTVPEEVLKEVPAITDVTPETTGISLYNRAIEIIRKETFLDKTERHSFSTQDFPRASNANPFQPVEYLPVMISQPRTVEMTDANGYTTILRTDGFGKSICMQERGFKGDGNPPLWYRVPVASCGHLKHRN